MFQNVVKYTQKYCCHSFSQKKFRVHGRSTLLNSMDYSNYVENSFWIIEMSKDTKHHDWKKEQPHHVKTGEITPEKYAREHPDKVEWVKVKK